MKMAAERWSRMYQILITIEIMDNEYNPTTIRDITAFLKKSESDIDINVVNSSIRHYRKNGLVKRKHDHYKRPYHYELSNKGISQLEWLEEFADELLLDLEI